MQRQFTPFIKKFFWSSAILGFAIGAMQLPAVPQPPNSNKISMDNIYYENDNLPDDADVFPRMGKIAGNEQAQTNCRVWL